MFFHNQTLLINWLADLAFGVEVNLAAHIFELLGHLIHALKRFNGIERGFFIIREPVRIIAHILRDFHGAEFGSAHGAEMGDLMRVFGQGLVMEALGRFRVKREVELIFPAELETCLLYTSPSPRD